MVSPKERPVILNRLCKNCDLERSLPKLMVITDASIQTKSKIPVAGGGFGDVYEGEFVGRPAAIKVMRFWTSNDLDDFLSVCTTFRAVPKEPTLKLSPHRGSVERLSPGGTYGTRMFYRCLVRRLTCRH